MAVYIHIPFCKQLCAYCDFYFSVSLQRKEQMLNCLVKEMELKSQINTQQKSSTLYFGGGTPSVFSISYLKQLSEKAIDLFFAKFPEEFTIEANPDDLDETYLRGLKSIGVNRLSIGIQSFIDRDLKKMNRRHSAKQAFKSVEMAQQIGFNNISIDLIYGFPNMSINEWEYNLKSAISLGVQHVSAYHLSIESRSVFGKLAEKGLISPVDEDTSAKQYELLENELNNAGFTHYEISNFSLPGFASKHNSAYWTKQPYMGIGPSAHSYNGFYTRQSNVSNNIKYIESINNGIIPETVETLSETEYYNESIITAFRTNTGISLDMISAQFREKFLAKAEKHIKNGTVINHNCSYSIKPQYFLVSDNIISDFIVTG